MQNKVEIMVYKKVKCYQWDFDTMNKILKTTKAH